eukprot:06080.XXX_161012_161598_1 [CDS] Oithona nana genome sequencing.
MHDTNSNSRRIYAIATNQLKRTADTSITISCTEEASFPGNEKVMLMHSTPATSSQPTASASSRSAVSSMSGTDPPPPRIMTSSPAGHSIGVTYSTSGGGGPGHENSSIPVNTRAATLSALGSSIGSSGGGQSDSGFAASTSSG